MLIRFFKRILKKIFKIIKLLIIFITKIIKKVIYFVPNDFAKQKIKLTGKMRNKELRQRKRRLHLVIFIIWTLFGLFFYDMAEEYEFLYLYEFHKWWA